MRAIESRFGKGIEMKTLTNFMLGTLLVIGPALAAQTSTAAKPASPTSSATKKTVAKKAAAKKVAHSKTAHSKSTKKAVAKKAATPVTPVAAKK